MNYDERKKQLDRATRSYLLENGGLYFDDYTGQERKTFTPIYCGEPRTEYLSEIYIDDDDEVRVNTWYREEGMENEEIEYTSFVDFSNDEMEEIMRLAGIPVPES